MGRRRPAEVPLHRIDAVVFDMDGVITDTASVHAAAWKRMFDDFLLERARSGGRAAEAFNADEDYRRFVDGRSRDDGVRGFLASRGIELADGEPSDPPDRDTVWGLGNRKNGYFLDRLREDGARAYPSTIELVRRLRERGVGVAAISASRNMSEVLDSAGVGDLFEVRVDGRSTEDLGMPGKPDPAVFVEAARRLGAEPARTAIVEDALAGVEAGRRGGFGFVVGVARTGHAEALLRAGADVVVGDLGELALSDADQTERLRGLPWALERSGEIRELVSHRRPAVFLDYDGTLTPIVERPEDAALPGDTRAVIQRLAAACPVAVLSGRDLADVRRMVDIDGIAYAGSHGFDIAGPDGAGFQRGTEYLAELDAAEGDLGPLLAGVPGARIERKRFAIAVHTRQVRDERLRDVEAAVEQVASATTRLRRTGGKRVLELRPNVDWDKGKALRWLLEVLDLAEDEVLPVYIGDDETDEDAFREVLGDGLGIVVRGEGDDRRTSARYALRDPDDARDLLALLATAAEARP